MAFQSGKELRDEKSTTARNKGKLMEGGRGERKDNMQ